MSPTRRRVLATAAGALGALAGCAGRTDTAERSPGRSTGTGGGTGTARDPTPGAGGGRPTTTARDPEPLDVGGRWTQRGAGPGRTAFTSAAGVPDAGRPHWRLRRIRSGPVVVADGRLFGYAELNEDPAARGTVTETREPGEGPAHVVNGPPYLVARDASDGRVAWTVPLPDGGAGWPAVAGDRVVMGVRGRVAAHRAADGGVVWEHDLGEHPVGDPAVAGGVAVAPLPGVVDGATGEYVHEPAVRAYDLADGTERWTTRMPKRGLGLAVGEGGPGGGTVVAVSHDYDQRGTVLGLSLADGSERWRTVVPGFTFPTPVADGAGRAPDGTAYVASSAGDLRALALADGEPLWRRAFDGDPSAPAVDGDAAYVGAGGRLLALDPDDGSERWAFDAGEGAGSGFAAPAVADGVVYAGGTEVGASLVAVDAAEGTERWSFVFPESVVEGDVVTAGLEAQPAVVDGAVYAYAVDGLYAFGSE